MLEEPGRGLRKIAPSSRAASLLSTAKSAHGLVGRHIRAPRKLSLRRATLEVWRERREAPAERSAQEPVPVDAFRRMPRH